jgi:hypothetical protein
MDRVGNFAQMRTILDVLAQVLGKLGMLPQELVFIRRNPLLGCLFKFQDQRIDLPLPRTSLAS